MKCCGGNGWFSPDDMPKTMRSALNRMMIRYFVASLILAIAIFLAMFISVRSSGREFSPALYLVSGLLFFPLFRTGFRTSLGEDFEWCYSTPDRVLRRGAGYMLDDEGYRHVGGKGAMFTDEHQMVFVRFLSGDGKVTGRAAFGYNWTEEDN